MSFSGRLTALLGPETNPEDAMKVIGDLIKGSQVKSAPAPGAGGEEAGVPKVGAAGAGYAAARAIELAQSLLASPVPDASSDAVDPLSALFGKVVAELEAGTPPIPPPDLAEAYRLRMKYRKSAVILPLQPPVRVLALSSCVSLPPGAFLLLLPIRRCVEEGCGCC